MNNLDNFTEIPWHIIKQIQVEIGLGILGWDGEIRNIWKRKIIMKLEKLAPVQKKNWEQE